MKNKFPGYYTPTEEEFKDLWDDSIFILDTNVLLNLYRYTDKTRDELIKIFNKITDRLWIPHQVALEYHKDRIKVINDQKNAYPKIRNILKEYRNKIVNDLQEFRMHPYFRTNNIVKILDSSLKRIEKYLKDIEKQHPDIIDDDYVMNTITSIFENKVGLPYPEDTYKQICKTGESRYQKKVPPGFKDKEYGDLIIWFQIINKAKETKKPIIFVTDDKKEDWWLKYEGKKKPRPELINEIYSEAGTKFYMYQSDRFMYWAQKWLGEEIQDDSIKEVENIVKSTSSNDWFNQLAVEIQKMSEEKINSAYGAVQAADAAEAAAFPELYKIIQTADAARTAAFPEVYKIIQAAEAASRAISYPTAQVMQAAEAASRAISYPTAQVMQAAEAASRAISYPMQQIDEAVKAMSYPMQQIDEAAKAIDKPTVTQQLAETVKEEDKNDR
jgi:hypothetical protein